MINFTTQKEFFDKIESSNYWYLENNLCWLINTFLVLKELGSEVSEQRIFDRAIKTKSFDKVLWWKYDKLILIFRHFCIQWNINFWSIEVLEPKLFHNRKVKKILYNLKNQFYIASIKLDENHLIIIDRVEYNNIFYTSVWTKQYEPKHNQVIKMDDFFRVYNKRWILINL